MDMKPWLDETSKLQIGEEIYILSVQVEEGKGFEKSGMILKMLQATCTRRS
jgi:hypothetical protein